MLDVNSKNFSIGYVRHLSGVGKTNRVFFCYLGYAIKIFIIRVNLRKIVIRIMFTTINGVFENIHSTF